MNWSINRKRKRGSENENNERLDFIRASKKPRYVLEGNEMIYSIGNEIHFTSDINKDSIEQIIKEINKIIEDNSNEYRTEDEKLTIAYIVDSPGGCVDSVLKFVDYVNLVKNKHPYVEFVSIITGLVASAGTIMCIIADKRVMTKHAHAMIHELSSGMGGKYTHLMSYAQHLENMHTALLDIYLDRSNKTKKEMEKILNTETWFSSKEYLDHGFIDEIK